MSMKACLDAQLLYHFGLILCSFNIRKRKKKKITTNNNEKTATTTKKKLNANTIIIINAIKNEMATKLNHFAMFSDE